VAEAPALLHDRALLARTVRFILTIMMPVTAGFIAGPHPWVLYGLLGALTSFLGDDGGPAGTRLGHMLAGPLCFLAGAGLGVACGDSLVAFLALSAVVGFAYGLVEGGHPVALLMARFGGYGLVLGGHGAYGLAPSDAAAVLAVAGLAWAISVFWDLAAGGLREGENPPVLPAMLAAVRAWRARLRFALTAAAAVAAASAVVLWLGIGHGFWAMLTVLVVLRSDMGESAAATAHRVLGTLLGAAAVAAFISLQPPPGALFAALGIAAALRWPALRVSETLGLACITAFVLLMGDLLSPDAHAAMDVLRARTMAIMVGCCMAMAAHGVNLGAAAKVGAKAGG